MWLKLVIIQFFHASWYSQQNIKQKNLRGGDRSKALNTVLIEEITIFLMNSEKINVKILNIV